MKLTFNQLLDKNLIRVRKHFNSVQYQYMARTSRGDMFTVALNKQDAIKGANEALNKTNIGILVQLPDNTYKCTCGGKPEYVGSEWKWECPKCGAKNYT